MKYIFIVLCFFFIKAGADKLPQEEVSVEQENFQCKNRTFNFCHYSVGQCVYLSMLVTEGEPHFAELVKCVDAIPACLQVGYAECDKSLREVAE